MYLRDTIILAGLLFYSRPQQVFNLKLENSKARVSTHTISAVAAGSAHRSRSYQAVAESIGRMWHWHSRLRRVPDRRPQPRAQTRPTQLNKTTGPTRRIEPDRLDPVATRVCHVTETTSNESSVCRRTRTGGVESERRRHRRRPKPRDRGRLVRHRVRVTASLRHPHQRESA